MLSKPKETKLLKEIKILAVKLKSPFKKNTTLQTGKYIARIHKARIPSPLKLLHTSTRIIDAFY